MAEFLKNRHIIPTINSPPRVYIPYNHLAALSLIGNMRLTCKADGERDRGISHEFRREACHYPDFLIITP